MFSRVREVESSWLCVTPTRHDLVGVFHFWSSTNAKHMSNKGPLSALLKKQKKTQCLWIRRIRGLTSCFMSEPLKQNRAHRLCLIQRGFRYEVQAAIVTDWLYFWLKVLQKCDAAESSDSCFFLFVFLCFQVGIGGLQKRKKKAVKNRFNRLCNQRCKAV